MGSRWGTGVHTSQCLSWLHTPAGPSRKLSPRLQATEICFQFAGPVARCWPWIMSLKGRGLWGTGFRVPLCLALRKQSL